MSENWIDLSNLPHKIAKNGRNTIDWEHSVGYECSFLFDGIRGLFTIYDITNLSKTHRITIKYNDELFETSISNLYQCLLKKIVFKFGKFKYEIGEHIVDQYKDITILNREFREKHSHNKYSSDYINHDKYYYIRCNKCMHEYWIIESSIYDKRGITCPACGKNPRYVVKGVNDITTTDPWMIPYFNGGYDRASMYIKSSREKPGLVCPFCQRINYKQEIQELYLRKKVYCICNDNISYPNKFMFNFFEQLYINKQIISFEREKRFSWSNNRIYDLYITLPLGQKMICENHGDFHYTNKRISSKARSLEEEQLNDVFKEKVAIENGIKYYIQLDCRESKKEWIKESVIHSKLNTIFDLSCIDFDKCENFALGNLLKDVCDMKDQYPNITQKELANIFHISIEPIKRYLKRGKEIGLCS